MLYFILCIAILFLLVYLLQRRLIYFPEYSTITPQEAGMGQMQVITFSSSKAWYQPAIDPDKPCIVYFHGNAGHIGYRASLIKPYLRQGFGVLLHTYRGYSGNPGKPSEQGLYSDAREAIDYLLAHGVSADQLVLLGESIGSAVAIQMATVYPIRALICFAPFTSMVDVGRYHYPWLPIGWMLKDRYNSYDKASRLQTAVCIIHGQNDTIIPVEMGQKLCSVFKGPKTCHIIPNRGHNDLFEPGLVVQFLMKT